MSHCESTIHLRAAARRRCWAALRIVVCALSFSACGEAAEPFEASAGEEPASLEQSATESAQQPYAVGTVRIMLAVGETRSLPVQLWYPAVESARAEASRGRPLADIEPAGRERTLLLQQLATAPNPGTSHIFHAADAPPVFVQEERFPLLIFSHCNECMRYSSLTVAEHLASLGFVVAAPDHVNNTLYDLLQGTSVGLELEHFLPQRVVDVTKLLDTLLDEESSVVPEGLRGRIDADRVGAFGHSFGGMTTGLFLQKDARVKAAAVLAVAIGVSPLLEPLMAENVVVAEPSEIDKPILYVKAGEDISIMNSMLDDNYQRHAGEAWRVTIRDTSHYSVTDICGIAPNYDLGSCSPALRATVPLVPYAPLDIVRARDLTKQYVGAFFLHQLLGRGRGPADVPRNRDARLEHKR